MSESVYLGLAIAGVFYVMAKTGLVLTHTVMSLFNRVTKTRLERAANIVCDELEKISGSASGSLRIETCRYVVVILAKQTSKEKGND